MLCQFWMKQCPQIDQRNPANPNHSWRWVHLHVERFKSLERFRRQPEFIALMKRLGINDWNMRSTFWLIFSFVQNNCHCHSAGMFHRWKCIRAHYGIFQSPLMRNWQTENRNAEYRIWNDSRFLFQLVCCCSLPDSKQRHLGSVTWRAWDRNREKKLINQLANRIKGWWNWKQFQSVITRCLSELMSSIGTRWLRIHSGIPRVHMHIR